MQNKVVKIEGKKIIFLIIVNASVVDQLRRFSSLKGVYN